MKHIALIAEDPSFGASANLVNALRQAGYQVSDFFKNKDPKGFWQTLESPAICEDRKPLLFQRPDQTIIVGSNAWDWIKSLEKPAENEKPYVKTTVILTDTYYIRNHERLNAEFEAAGVTVFAMPDLFQYRKGLPTLPYYPPFSLEHVKVKKNKHFTICHSPGPKAATNKKGTLDIRKAVQQFKQKYPATEYIEITGKSHAECLELKAKAHVFIDQIVPEGSMPHGYKGGIGKSGVEAMHLQCEVIGNVAECEIMPPMSINVTDAYPLHQKMEFVYRNKLRSDQEMVDQYFWAKQYTSYQFVANHVLQTIKTTN